MARKRIPKKTQENVLLNSKRRCCWCFRYNNDKRTKRGQIAHVDGDNTNTDESNLAYLCLDCHDEYDTKRSQSKGLLEQELIAARDVLHAWEPSDVPEVQREAQVISYNQSGGITARDVTINTAPEPGLEMVEHFSNQRVNERFHSRVELIVESPYPPAGLYVAVHAASIIEIEVVPQRSGGVMVGHSGVRDGCAFTNLIQPSGRYHVDIYTFDAEREIEIEFSFS
jgi:hypothetical protein